MMIQLTSVDADTLIRNDMIEVNEMVGREYVVVVIFESTKDIFNGHEPDPSYEIENPDGWFWEFKVEDIRETYHPNSKGHIHLGEVLSLFFKDDLLGSASTNDGIPCTHSFWVSTNFFHCFLFTNFTF